MHLDNPFSKETRELFRDVWVCWECGQNGQETGGLELHHITGRDSDSAYNINHPRLMTPELKEWTDKQKKHYA